MFYFHNTHIQLLSCCYQDDHGLMDANVIAVTISDIQAAINNLFFDTAHIS